MKKREKKLYNYFFYFFIMRHRKKKPLSLNRFNYQSTYDIYCASWIIFGHTVYGRNKSEFLYHLFRTITIT